MYPIKPEMAKGYEEITQTLLFHCKVGAVISLVVTTRPLSPARRKA